VSKFFLRTFAVIGFFVTLLVVLGLAVYAHQVEHTPSEPDSVVLVLDLDQDIIEQNDASPLDLALHDDAMPLLDILHAIDQARADPHVKALVARFGDNQPSFEHAQEIRAALLRFRTSGKPMYSFASSYGSFGLGNRAYYLASSFDNIWLQPVGSVGLTGVAIETPFGKAALDKLGVKPDFMQREEYKSIMETATRDDYSPLVKTEMQAMIEDISNQLASGIAEGRKWDVERVKRLMARGPFTGDEALKAGLVTQIGYADELETKLDEKFGKDSKQIDIGTYLSYDGGGKHAPAKGNGNKVALIYGTGLIVDKSSPGGIADEKTLGADTLAGAFEDAANDKDVKAILFRIDSPGGSPEASETIRRAMMHAQGMGKPVVVSMGDVAASGGYWVAMNADYIVAEPGTLTGSIGVVGGKFALKGLLDKIGVSFGVLKTTENSGMWEMIDEFTPSQRERVNALLDDTYHAFVLDVATARKIPMAKMPDIAKGRVWTGQQALKVGLVDQLGGYDVALAAIRTKLKLGENDMMELEPFPAPETPVERVMKLLRGFGVEGAMVNSALLQWQGMQAKLGPILNGATLSGQPVSARMPANVLGVVR
jgi:protease-4